MNRRTLLVALGTGTVVGLAGCADDEDGTGQEESDELDPEELEEQLEESTGEDGEYNEPEQAVETFLNADAEGDAETLNDYYYGDGAFDDDLDPVPGAEIEAIVEWDTVEAIVESVNAPEEQAEEVIDDLEAEREETMAEDSAVDELTYVFAVISSDEVEEIQYIMVVVEVDGEWLIDDQQQVV